jgi:hypothetical protein
LKNPTGSNKDQVKKRRSKRAMVKRNRAAGIAKHRAKTLGLREHNNLKFYKCIRTIDNPANNKNSYE